MALAFAIHAANLVLGVVVLFILLDAMARRWSEFPREIKFLYFLPLNFLFGLLVVSGAQLAEHRPLTFDTAIISMVKLSALFILWRTKRVLYRTGGRHEGSERNPDSGTPDRDIQA